MKLSEKTKKSIAKLVEKDFVIDVLNQHLAKYYQDFKEIKSIELNPFKRHLGVTSAVFVVEYKIKYINLAAQIKDLDIFVSAHSDGSREGAYKKTNILYEYGFSKGKYRVTRPLFFLDEQKAFFYVASPGKSFFDFFTQDVLADLSNSMQLMTAWIKKLHSFDTKVTNFKWPKFDILDMVPAPERFVKNFYESDQKLGQKIETLINDLDQMDKEFRKTIGPILVYGDFHPENVIIKSLETQDIEMIDFTDIALGDPMMDIGTFIQQFDFMGHNFVSRQTMNQYKQSFVETYFAKDLKDIDIEYINRINLYQSWAAMRTTVFLFYMKDVFNPIQDLLEDSVQYLELAKNNKRSLNVN